MTPASVQSALVGDLGSAVERGERGRDIQPTQQGMPVETVVAGLQELRQPMGVDGLTDDVGHVEDVMT